MDTGWRFLVVDDDEDQTEYLAAVLRQHGIDVTQARSAEEALQVMASEGPFDLIVSDYNMPQITGLQFLHMARTAGANAPVVMLTAAPGHVGEALEEVPGTELLAKPCPVQRLVDKARELIEAKHLSRRAG